MAINYIGKPKKKSDIPPQANNMRLIVQLINRLRESPIAISDLTRILGLSERQAKYYTDAVIFMGVCKISMSEGHTLKRAELSLTSSSEKWFLEGKTSSKLGEWLKNNNIIEKYQRTLGSSALSNATLRRRKQSLDAWRKWIVLNLEK